MARKTRTKGGASGLAQSFSLLAPDALIVQLVGDFTQWQERPIDMQKDGNGIWRATVKLPPGEHHYRFLVDGEFLWGATAMIFSELIDILSKTILKLTTKS